MADIDVEMKTKNGEVINLYDRRQEANADIDADNRLKEDILARFSRKSNVTFADCKKILNELDNKSPLYISIDQ